VEREAAERVLKQLVSDMVTRVGVVERDAFQRVSSLTSQLTVLRRTVLSCGVDAHASVHRTDNPDPDPVYSTLLDTIAQTPS